MFIIDVKRKGNVVRFLLGNDPEYWGDDWNDYSYENSCGPVYDEYVKETYDIVFPFDWLVLEPADGCYRETGFCRADFKERKVPCLVAVPPESVDANDWDLSFAKYGHAAGAIRFYFGDAKELLCSKKIKE